MGRDSGDGESRFGKSRRNGEQEGVDTAFKLCDTHLFKQLITQIPRAQERILLAFDKLEERSPYDSVKNEEFRKFIRE